MSIAETSAITDVVQRVLSWPVSMRIALARRILQTVEEGGAPQLGPGFPRGYSAAEVRAILKIDKPAPDDAMVEQWMEEYRLEKYGK